MKYLLDVNALVAICIRDHEFHDRVSSWLGQLKGAEFLTCAVTELGLLRILAQSASFGLSIEESKRLLSQLKSKGLGEFTFLVDARGAGDLPSWVKGAKQVTDGHLVDLAKVNDAKLATLDKGIPETLLIP